MILWYIWRVNTALFFIPIFLILVVVWGSILSWFVSKWILAGIDFLSVDFLAVVIWSRNVCVVLLVDGRTRNLLLIWGLRYMLLFNRATLTLVNLGFIRHDWVEVGLWWVLIQLWSILYRLYALKMVMRSYILLHALVQGSVVFNIVIIPCTLWKLSDVLFFIMG
jgi:hypothetical protein